MPMSKKHYEAVASAINNVMWQTHTDAATMAYVVAALTEVFADDNPRFDRQRFTAACTKPTNTVLQEV